jgi:hypothetical protein
MVGFMNNLKDVKHDFTIVEEWAEHLHREFPSLQENIDLARKVGKHTTEVKGQETLKHSVHNLIESLLSAAPPTPQKPAHDYEPNHSVSAKARNMVMELPVHAVRNYAASKGITFDEARHELFKRFHRSQS